VIRENSEVEQGVDLDGNDLDDLEYSNLQELDLLGAEGGIDVTDLVEDLGFAEL
jgi:hypothetical protein